MKFIILVFFSQFTFASINTDAFSQDLLKQYAINYEKTASLKELRALTLKNGTQSVAPLIEVMKNGKYPDKNRWMATFLLGEIMGKKSSPFISKFLQHPSWVMRMASLKTLLALKEDRYAIQYSLLLKDDSLLVRRQALENIRQLKIKSLGPNVWSMLYDRKNYSKSHRTNIIKEAIKTVGELNFQEAKNPLLKMIQKNKYDDIFPEVDHSLIQLTGHNSPDGDIKSKRLFWSRKSLDTIIE